MKAGTLSMTVHLDGSEKSPHMSQRADLSQPSGIRPDERAHDNVAARGLYEAAGSVAEPFVMYSFDLK